MDTGKEIIYIPTGKNTQQTDKQSSYLWEGNYTKGTWEGLSVTFLKPFFTALTLLCNCQTAFTQKICLPGSHPRRKNKISNTNTHTDTQTHTQCNYKRFWLFIPSLQMLCYSCWNSHPQLLIIPPISILFFCQSNRTFIFSNFKGRLHSPDSSQLHVAMQSHHNQQDISKSIPGLLLGLFCRQLIQILYPFCICIPIPVTGMKMRWLYLQLPSWAMRAKTSTMNWKNEKGSWGFHRTEPTYSPGLLSSRIWLGK